MTDIGVDYGRGRTGFAASRSGVVLPLDPLLRTTWEGIVKRLRDIQELSGEGTVVLGLPLSASGRPTDLSREVEELALYLKGKGFSVELVGETGSSLEAGRTLGRTGERDGRDDSMA
ncbi:MAG: Holliday junction resolvase RuvX, partial [Candidatus Fermentibacteraceae bacterium]|nr:Holliday junction resolvase RuvX [Candidatus Fermentibacteraceae bacterium]